LQAGELHETDYLDQLRDGISTRLGIDPLPTPRWNDRRDAFLRTLPELLKQLPDVTPVPRETHEKACKQLADSKEECKKKEVEAEKLRALVADLKKLKDQAKVAAVMRKHSTATGTFESLVGAAKEALRPFPSSVREALYYGCRGEDYRPKDREWDDVQRPIENGLLTLNSEENGVVANDDDPKVRKAANALDQLEKWLDQAPGRFSNGTDLSLTALSRISSCVPSGRLIFAADASRRNVHDEMRAR